MEKFTKHKGKCAPLPESNVDTDQIVPKKFLLSVSRTGYADALFSDRKFNKDGTLNKTFVLNNPKFSDSSILVTGENFGCGSSREHAPWALHEYGFRVIIARSYADIFYGNCFKIGLLPIVLGDEEIRKIEENIEKYENYFLTIDLSAQTITDEAGFSSTFEIDDFLREQLINGFDEIDLTLLHEEEITEYEKRRHRLFLNL